MTEEGDSEHFFVNVAGTELVCFFIFKMVKLLLQNVVDNREKEI